MMNMRWLDKDHVQLEMKRFLSRFDTKNPKIALKIRHTYRTAALCEMIAAQEGFDDELRDAAWLAGMLHDIGRFVQLAEYDTFMDALSIGHARLSARMLFDEGLIAEFIDTSVCDFRLLEAMHTAIALHSDWRLPEDLDEATWHLCAILRDADKIDILRVNHEESTEVIYPFSEEELLMSGLTPEVMRAFDAQETVPTALKELPADYALGHCAFGWELVFPASKKAVIEQGYLRKLFDRLWVKKETRAYFSNARERMFAWLEINTCYESSSSKKGSRR